jgi:hypothetical protein
MHSKKKEMKTMTMIQDEPNDIIYEVEGADIDETEQTDAVFIRDGKGRMIRMEVADDA